MAIDLSFGGLDNEYIGQAERARKEAGPGGFIKKLLQGFAEAVGISNPVGDEPDKSSAKAVSNLQDLGTDQKPPEMTEVTNKKGDVIGAIEVASRPSLVQPLPMTQRATSGPLMEIDPTTGALFARKHMP